MPTPPWFDELAEFLRIPSVSADQAHAPDVVAAGTWVCDLIRGAGGSAELIDWHGQPLAIGELRASRDPEHAPTVLMAIIEVTSPGAGAMPRVSHLR